MRFPSSFQRTSVFVIPTFRCNLSCEFCLFRHNRIPECGVQRQSVILKSVLSLCAENHRDIVVKITGGEPLLVDLYPLLKVIESHHVDFIGVGTNGTLSLPSYFNEITQRTNLYRSIHTKDEAGKLPFSEFRGDVINPNISHRLSCNLIRGGVDSINKIVEYLTRLPQKVRFICFRELNNISIDSSQIYDQFIYDYIKYREENLVSMKGIISSLDNDWKFVKTDNFGFIKNTYYNFHGLEILFRKMDEKKMLDIADSHPDVIDEIVIHPDGLVTGCWDRTRKVITPNQQILP